jgi:hypothetical protein
MIKPYIGQGDTYFTTIDQKKFMFTRGDDKSRQDALEKAQAHDRNRVAAIESKLQRPLTQAEYFAGSVFHHDSRSQFERERDAKFTPVRAPESKYHKHKAELLRKIQERDVAKMDTLERQLYDLERLEQRDAEQLAEQAAKEQHLKNPRVKAALKELNALLDSYRWNDEIDAGEVQRVKNAIKQWEAHDADTTVAESMLKSAMDSNEARIKASDDLKRETIRQIEATLAGERKPRKVEINRNQTLREQAHDLILKMYDSDEFSFNETDRVQTAINAFDADSSNSAPLEKLVDCFAVSDSQTLV